MGLGSNTNDAALTPGRQTWIEFDPSPRYDLAFPSFYMTRKAHQIGRGNKRGNRAQRNVFLEKSVPAWRLAHTADALHRLIRSDETTPAIPPATALTLAPGIERTPGYRAPTDLTGLGALADIAAQAMDVFRKNVGAGDTWAKTLSADQTAYPGPSESPAPTVSLDRVLVGTATYPANSGFTLGIIGTATLFAAVLPSAETPAFRLYFGGATDVTPASAYGGAFCLSRTETNDLLLFEREAAGTWVERARFVGPPADAVTYFSVEPVGRRHIVIRAVGMLQIGKAAQQQRALETFESGASVYRATTSNSGFLPVSTITGAGSVKVDLSRNWRGSFTLFRHLYKTTGTLRDQPFNIPWPKIPADTVFHVRISAETPTGTAITYQLYDATDDTEIVAEADGTFLLEENQNRLYLVFTLTTSDEAVTPLLFGWEAECEGLSITRTPNTLTSNILSQVSVTSATTDPGTATASCIVHDLTNQVGRLLRTRGSIHCKLKTTDGRGNTVILHEGLTLQTSGNWRKDRNRAGIGGNLITHYPSSDWRDWEVQIGSMWGRVSRQLNESVEDFSNDPDATPGPSGEGTPYKITEIIRILLTKVGWPASQLDIPDNDLRLWPVDRTVANLALFPTQSQGDFIRNLCDQYLNYFLTWDPNAGAAGKWRLLLNKFRIPTDYTPEYAPLARFVGGPTSGVKVTSHPRSYAFDETFIISYESWVSPPEANYVLVTAAGELNPTEGEAKRLTAVIYNPKSFDWDPANPTADPDHPDYLGEKVPIIAFIPTLAVENFPGFGERDVNNPVVFVARRIYDLACVAQKWCRIETPALYVTDPTDDDLDGNYRPLRFADPITVFGEPAIVHSANYAWDHDNVQRMVVEARFITPTAEGEEPTP